MRDGIGGASAWRVAPDYRAFRGQRARKRNAPAATTTSARTLTTRFVAVKRLRWNEGTLVRLARRQEFQWFHGTVRSRS